MAHTTDDYMVPDEFTPTTEEIMVNALKNVADSIQQSNLEISNSIINASSLLYSGLHEIADEMAKQNKIFEWDNLKNRIRYSEEWLYNKGYIKEFYSKTNLAQKYKAEIKPSFIELLAFVCKKIPYLNDSEDNDDLIHILQTESLVNYIHPIYILQQLIIGSKGFERGNKTFEYNKDIPNPYPCIKKVSCHWVKKPYFYFPEFDSYQKDLSKLTSFNHNLDLNPEEVFNVILKANEKLSETWLLSTETKFKWLNFFKHLNVEIAFYNLRMLDSYLENFKRKKMLL